MGITIEQLLSAAEDRRRAAELRVSEHTSAMRRFGAQLDAAGGETAAPPDLLARGDQVVKALREAKDEQRRAEGALEAARKIAGEEAENFARTEQVHRVQFGDVPAPGGQVLALGGGTGQPVASAPKWARQDHRPAVVERGQRFADHELVREQIAASAERDAHIIGTHGDLAGLVRAISTTSGASALVPTSWSAQVIDKARNAAVCFQAGATLVPMDAKVVQIARLTQDPAPAFRAEGNAIPATDPAFDYVQLTATTLGTVVVASIEVLQDAPGADQLVTDILAKSIALEIDKAALFGQLGANGTNDEGAAYGLASPYPKGLLKNLLDNAAGNVLGWVTNGTSQTAATPWLEALALYYKVARANEVPGAIVSNTALVQQYDGMVDTTYQPIRKPAVLAGVPWLQSNVIPSFTRGTMSNRATDAFCGDWSQLLIGQRLQLEIRTLTERYAELGQVGFLAVWRGDVQVARPAAFACYRALQGAV